MTFGKKLEIEFNFYNVQKLCGILIMAVLVAFYVYAFPKFDEQVSNYYESDVFNNAVGIIFCITGLMLFLSIVSMAILRSKKKMVASISTMIILLIQNVFTLYMRTFGGIVLGILTLFIYYVCIEIYGNIEVEYFYINIEVMLSKCNILFTILFLVIIVPLSVLLAVTVKRHKLKES